MSNAIDKVEESTFKLKSENFKNDEWLPNNQVYKTIGCDGGNLSPQLSWKNAPINTRSFALICHDPDAPKENGWYHWLVVNISKNIASVDEGKKIETGFETVTDFEKTGYDGACPPKGHGTHHYNFTIYALDTDFIDVDKNINPKKLEDLILSHTIAKSTLTALYERK